MLLRQKILSTQILDRLKEKGWKFHWFIDSIHWYLIIGSHHQPGYNMVHKVHKNIKIRKIWTILEN